MARRNSSQAKQSVRSLRVAEARWRSILGSARDAIISIDVNGRITLFNRSAEQIFGYAADEVMGKTVSILMPAPFSAEHDGYIRDYQRTGIPKAIGRIRQVHGRRKSGEVFPIELSVSETRVDDETFYMAIIRDVTELERMHEALLSAEARSRAIIDASVEGIISVSESGIIESFNPAAERMFGYSAAEVTGRNVSLLMPSPFSETHDSYIERYLASGEKKIIGTGREVVARRKDGTLFPIHLAVSEVFLGERRIFTAMVQDLTERKRAEAELRELHQISQQRQRLADIGAITAQIVHDLGNPLAAISMQAQLIVRRARRDPAQPVGSILQSAEQIVDRVRYLDSLVREFLEFAREQRLNLTEFDLEPFLKSVVTLWRPVGAGSLIDVSLNVLNMPAAGLRLRADQEKLQRVLDNLIKNAIEAIGTGPGVVEVGVEESNDQRVRLFVRDDGPGIPQSLEVFRLFETTKPQGSGLGLPIVRQIVSAHGGGIDFAFAPPHGTIFRIDLPRHGPER